MAAVVQISSASLLSWPPDWFSRHGPALLSNGEAWTDRGQDLGLDAAKGVVLAWCDWNADTYLDAVLLNKDGKTVSIYTWSHDDMRFEALAGANFTARDHVVNVTPGDWNHDGRPDLLVMTRKNPMDSNEAEVGLSIYLGSSGRNGSAFLASPIELPSSSRAQPIAFDFTGDFRTDLLGIPLDHIGSGLGLDQFRLWQNFMSPSSHNWTMTPSGLTASPGDCTFDGPHTSAVVDLDGDCLSDLFIICKSRSQSYTYSYQVFLNKKGEGLHYAASGDFPKGFQGSVTFADFDRDGTTDMIFPVCLAGSCSIHVAYNVQMPICTSRGLSGGGDACRPATRLCQGDPNWHFDLSPGKLNTAYQIISMREMLDGNQIVMTDEAFPSKPFHPAHLQAGDYNLDAFPDLLLLHTPDGSKSFLALLENTPCDEATCGDALTSAGRRTLRRVEAEVFTKYDDVRSASWVDLDEDGTLDILLQRAAPLSFPFFGTPTLERQMVFILNGLFHDGFFVKAFALNGACGRICTVSDGDGTRDKFKPLGAVLHGASFKYTLLDTLGERRAAQIAQSSMTVYNGLQLPYAFFGLGRTNNYLENLFVGTSAHQTLHSTNYEGVIPNAELVINPYQPALLQAIARNESLSSPLEDPGSPASWLREIYVRPSDYIGWVTLCVATLVLLLTALVLVLQARERRLDERMRRRTLPGGGYQTL